MRHTLIICLLCVACVSTASAQELRGIKNLLEKKGPPSFIVKSVEFRGNLLVCDEINAFERDKNEAKRLRGIVLLYCEPWDGLYLWIAIVQAKMRQATPLLGEETPGGNFLQKLPAKDQPCKLFVPVQISLAFVDKRGRVRRIARMTVDELQLKKHR